jgi:hypothetical protein
VLSQALTNNMYKPKNLISIACSFGLLFFCFNAVAQKPLVTAEKKQRLNVMAAQLKNIYAANFKKALLLAPQYNWETRKKTKDGRVISLQGLSPLGFPIYYQTYNNTTAAATTRTNTVQPGGVLGLNLSGSTTALNGKLAIWDGGTILSSHQEFAGKSIARRDAATVDEHATHVAGTMIARGVYAPARGMAFNATTLQSYDFDGDIDEMVAASAGLLLSNHSYGIIAGWSYDSDKSRWVWYGLPGDTEDYKFGYYDGDARNVDQMAVNAPYYLVVTASGNNRAYAGPAVGTEYFGYASRTDRSIVSKGPRPANLSSNTGFDVLPGFANAKNALTVGAVNQIPYGPVNRTDVVSSYFSSIGPTDDGRIKPDICGDGDNVLSTGSSSNTAYITESGTSMAAPNVTGSLYLLQEYYAQKNSGNFMRSATLKALVCHTAFDGGNTGPDYTFGWGVLDMQKAAQVITEKGSKSIINESSLTQGQTQTIMVTASGNGPLMATIAWTDVQGNLATDGTLNDPTPKLVNDLDIRINDGTTTYNPWVLNPAAPASAATRGDNVRDNVEQVYLDNAIPGRTYTLTVRHKGVLTSGPQAYSLVVTGVGGAAYCASAPASSADSRIDNFTLSNINNTPAAGCTTYSDYTNLVAQLEQGRTYPLSITLGTCGGNFDKTAKVYIDWNGDSTFDPVNELAATTTTITTSTGTYTANIVVPVTVTSGNTSLMRVVLVETNSPAVINPCGTYAKGETQDYRVQFGSAARDVGPVAVSNASIGGACAGNSNITVRLRNFGTGVISGIPVTVTITPSAGGAVTALTETYPGTLAPGAEEDFTFSKTYNTISGAVYTLTATTGLTDDVVAANNQVSATVTIASTPAPASLTANYCDDTQQYLLTGTGDGTLLWYTTATGGVPVATGSNTFSKTAPVNNTFYAGLNDFSTSVGPLTKSRFTGGSYSNQFGQAVKINTKIPVVIQSARLYIGNAGTIRFSVRNAAQEEVSSSTITVKATRTPAAAGAQADDATDQGMVYALNLLLPQAGDYTITATCSNGATIFRSSAGVTGYPFGSDVFSITGNNAFFPDNPTDQTAFRNFYYFFYDMKVASTGCASTTRVPVTVQNPAITQNGNTLVSNFTVNNQWYFNDQIIAGATGQTYIPIGSGNYQLKNMLVTGCTAISPVYTYIKADAAVSLPGDIKLSAYPVPAASDLNITFIAPQAGDLSLSLISIVGQTVYSSKANIPLGNYSTRLSVANLPAGTYVLRLVLGQKAYSTKVVIAR